MSAELKNCPLCGNKAAYSCTSKNTPIVVCLSCPLELTGFDAETEKAWTEKKTISHWNTRTSPWHKFDPADEKTWPSEYGNYLYQNESSYIGICLWNGGCWHGKEMANIVAYQPLPSPYKAERESGK